MVWYFRYFQATSSRFLNNYPQSTAIGHIFGDDNLSYLLPASSQSPKYCFKIVERSYNPHSADGTCLIDMGIIKNSDDIDVRILLSVYCSDETFRVI